MGLKLVRGGLTELLNGDDGSFGQGRSLGFHHFDDLWDVGTEVLGYPLFELGLEME